MVVRGSFGYPFYGPYGGFGWGFGPWYANPFFYQPYGFYGPMRGSASSVRVDVTPKQTQVYVDGYYAGVADEFSGVFKRLYLSPGGHALVLYLDGYHSVSQDVMLTPGKDLRIRRAMEPLAAGEANDPRPVPSAQPSQPAPSAGGAPQSAPPTGGTPRPADVTSTEAVPFGTLSIRIQPPDAVVLIDGQRWQGPESADRLIVQVSEGAHRVEVQKDGYVTFQAEIQVRRGETATLNVSLSPRNPQ